MKKLSFKHHKLILPFVLLVVFIIGVFFGSILASYDEGVPIITIMIFSLVLLTFTLCTLIFSMVVRFRDENHFMHEENKQHNKILHEKMKQVHDSVRKNKL